MAEEKPRRRDRRQAALGRAVQLYLRVRSLQGEAEPKRQMGRHLAEGIRRAGRAPDHAVIERESDGPAEPYAPRPVAAFRPFHRGAVRAARARPQPFLGHAAPDQLGAFRARVSGRLSQLSARGRRHGPARRHRAVLFRARRADALAVRALLRQHLQFAPRQLRVHRHHRGADPVDLDRRLPPHGVRVRRGQVPHRRALRGAARAADPGDGGRALARHLGGAALHVPGQGDARDRRGRSHRRRIRRQCARALAPPLGPVRCLRWRSGPVPRVELHARAGTDLRLAGRGVRRGDARRPRQSARAARRRNRHRRIGGADHGAHCARLGAARVLLAPDRRAARSAGESLAVRARALAGFAAAGFTLSAVPFLGLPAFYESFLYLVFHWIVLAVSWNILSGYSGYFSFGHGAFFGAGMYTTATLATKAGVPFLWTL